MNLLESLQATNTGLAVWQPSDIHKIMEKPGKLCVFCGCKVISKTKEHVIPRWLMQMTGDPKRNVNFQVFLPHDQGRHRTFSFDSFQFPACDSCNNNFAKLEGRAKTVIEKLLSRAGVFGSEWTTLLDWLDKVRIGIWLGTRSLDKNYVAVEPFFHIADRMGKKDRSLIIATARHGQRLSFFGTNSLTFRFMPSCFGLLINDIGLVNVSHEFLLSRRMGFPYGQDLRRESDRIRSYVPAPGRNRIMRPPLGGSVSGWGTIIHQCIFKDWQNSTFAHYWQSDYVTSNSQDHVSGLSVPFLETESGSIYPCTESSTSWIPTHTFDTTASVGQYLARRCVDLQQWLIKDWPDRVDAKEEKMQARKFVSLLHNELEGMRSAIKEMQ